MTYCVPEKPMEKQRTYVNSDFKSVDIKGKAGKPQGKKKSLEQNSRKGARMKINGTEKSGISAGTWNMTQGEDAVSKSIRKQIANAQKALQELSADKELTMEEKMKKRQDLQQQINDLNQQLRQHQVELRRERQRAQKEAADRQNNGNRQEQKGRQEQGLSGASMEAMVSADTAMKQSKSYGSVVARLEGEARVLKSEINLDQDRGQNVEDKLSRLSKVEERAEKATEAQIGILAEAGEKMEKAEEKDREEKAEKTAEKKETEEEKEVSQDRKEKERQEDGKSVNIRL